MPYSSSATITTVRKNPLYPELLPFRTASFRVYIESSWGSGNVGANVYLLRWMWEQGFSGMLEVIYDSRVEVALASMLGISDLDAPVIFQGQVRSVTFKTLENFSFELARDTAPFVDFAVTGALNEDVTYFLKKIHASIPPNFAEFFRAKFFLLMSNFYFPGSNGQYQSTIYSAGASKQGYVRIPDSWKTPLRFPTIHIPEVRGSLEALPPLNELVRDAQKGAIDLVPTYGAGVQYSDELLFTLALGAAAARRTSPGLFPRPLVFALFYERDVAALKQLFQELAQGMKGFYESSREIHVVSPTNASSLGDGINVIPIGRVPNPVYEAVINMPEVPLVVLEGASTMALVLQGGMGVLPCSHLPFIRNWAEWIVSQASKFEGEAFGHWMARMEKEGCLIPKKLTPESIELIAKYFAALMEPNSQLSNFFRKIGAEIAEGKKERYLEGFQGLLAQMEAHPQKTSPNLSCGFFSSSRRETRLFEEPICPGDDPFQSFFALTQKLPYNYLSALWSSFYTRITSILLQKILKRFKFSDRMSEMFSALMSLLTLAYFGGFFPFAVFFAMQFIGMKDARMSHALSFLVNNIIRIFHYGESFGEASCFSAVTSVGQVSGLWLAESSSNILFRWFTPIPDERLVQPSDQAERSSKREVMPSRTTVGAMPAF